ncbi:hypothetical protein HKX48_001464 [Thoreauomyces humboldtii]|nr:hypothetical protein HKX48_001464 [Thoreauomyces humboldtii]
MTKSFTPDDVSSASSSEHPLLMIRGKVYDVASFVDEHPGGKKILLKAAGKDATKQFNQFHSDAILAKFGPKFYVGDVAPSDSSSSSKL